MWLDDGPASCGRLAGFEHDDGLGHLIGHLNEPPAFIAGKSFDIKCDDTGVIVCSQILEQVQFPNQGFVADTYR